MDTKKKPKAIYLAALAIGIAGAAAIYFFLDIVEVTVPHSDALPIQAIFGDKIVYTTAQDIDTAEIRADCDDRGGSFNECGSVCPNDEASCVDTCAYTCELDEASRQNPNMATVPEQFTAQTAALKPSDGSANQGIATRDYDGSSFIHTLTAKLPPPADGSRYAGWLIDDNDRVIWTGALDRSGGGYALTYTSTQDLRPYGNVLISLEKIGEKTDRPGMDIMLSGVFK